jgi:hypothetical protein
MTSDNDLLPILRRLDEIERKLDRILEELRTPTALAIQCAGAVFQGRTDAIWTGPVGTTSAPFLEWYLGRQGWGQSCSGL